MKAFLKEIKEMDSELTKDELAPDLLGGKKKGKQCECKAKCEYAIVVGTRKG
jgi:hypothetical protein